MFTNHFSGGSLQFTDKVGVSVFRWLKEAPNSGNNIKTPPKKATFRDMCHHMRCIPELPELCQQELGRQGLGLIGTPPASKKGLQNLCSKNQRLGIWGKGAFSLRCTGCHVLRWFPPQNQYPQWFHGMYSHTLTIL